MNDNTIFADSPRLSNLSDFERQFPNEQACRDYFERLRWPDKITCPHCRSKETSKFRTGKLYWCKTCKKQFTVRVGTIFENSALPLRKWFLAIYLLTAYNTAITKLILSAYLQTITLQEREALLSRCLDTLQQNPDLVANVFGSETAESAEVRRILDPVSRLLQEFFGQSEP